MDRQTREKRSLPVSLLTLATQKLTFQHKTETQIEMLFMQTPTVSPPLCRRLGSVFSTVVTVSAFPSLKSKRNQVFAKKLLLAKLLLNRKVKIMVNLHMSSEIICFNESTSRSKSTVKISTLKYSLLCLTNLTCWSHWTIQCLVYSLLSKLKKMKKERPTYLCLGMYSVSIIFSSINPALNT